MERDLTKHYTNGEITIVWKPASCIHSTNCWKKDGGLPEVFNPRIKPWINASGANTERIIAHIAKCPSGALSFFHNHQAETRAEVNVETKIEAVQNGPLLVYGHIVIKDAGGNEKRKSNVTAFCRCGNSGNKPYCDGSHIKHNFEG